jgi:DNA-binding MarR family transcriptional regulator
MKQNDFLKELGYLGFTTRLKRISDAMMHDGRKMYQELDVAIEPNWFVIFKILAKNEKMTVTEIAENIQMSHPSVIAITNKMLSKQFLISTKDKDDSRKRMLYLSKKALDNMPVYQKIWDAGIEAINKALKGLDALNFITEMEERFKQSNFKERTLAELND